MGNRCWVTRRGSGGQKLERSAVLAGFASPPADECGGMASRPEMKGREAAKGWVRPVVLDSGGEILTEGDQDVPVDRWIRGAEGVGSRGG